MNKLELSKRLEKFKLQYRQKIWMFYSDLNEEFLDIFEDISEETSEEVLNLVGFKRDMFEGDIQFIFDIDEREDEFVLDFEKIENILTKYIDDIESWDDYQLKNREDEIKMFEQMKGKVEI